MADHNGKGNCWANARSCKECGPDDNCDVCHKHDSPRGGCDQCPRCDACEEGNRNGS